MSFARRTIFPGQRFRQLDGRQREQVVTVARLDEDGLGLPRVIFSAPSGREIRCYATQIEAAIAAGELFPADERPALTLYARQPEEMLAS